MEMTAADKLFNQMVVEKIRQDLVMSVKAFKKVVEDYAYLLNDDKEKFQALLVEACFGTGELVINDNGEFIFNGSLITEATPTEFKEKLFEALVIKVSNDYNAKDIMKEDETK